MPPRLLILAVAAFAIGVDGFVVAPILPELSRELGVSVAAAGQLITVFTLVYAIAAPVLTSLTGKADRKRLLVLTLLVFTAGNALSAVAPSYPVMMASRVIAALGAALYLPNASGAAVVLSPPERSGRALALVMGGLSAAGLIGVPFGTVVAQAVGPRGVFWMIVLLGLLASAGVAVFLPSVHLPGALSLRERLAMAARPNIAGLLVVTAVTLLGAYMVMAYVAPLLRETAGIAGRGLTLVMLVSGVAGMIGTAVAGRAIDAYGGRRVFAVAVGAAAVGTPLVLFAHNPVLTGVLIFAMGVASAGMVPAQQMRLMAAAPEAGTLLLSLNSSALYLGMSAGGGLGGALLATLGVTALPWCAAAVYLVALLVTLLPRRRAAALPAGRSGAMRT
ncbi:MFS transporter [Nonomuraea turcica]|uniref:MFS transporter n=1 Tax=Nonomuraea sp. G32 TaxID=3067274 RepID=UPI00273B0DBE|nr:MFS transporter [Nonomuraea sp. G32]MDP4508580.1 MFS transporter [Nonomuraea sp. G32]